MASGERDDPHSELDILRSIYLDEVQIDHDANGEHPWVLSITLHPSTAHVTESQFVRLTLHLCLTEQYPDAVPTISIRNSRGLSDEQIQRIQKELEEEAVKRRGEQVLYQLIEKAKDILTNSNIPFGHCVICLNSFLESESFTRTPCFHHFHTYCLASYLRHGDTHHETTVTGTPSPHKEPRAPTTAALCPVCREPLTYDLGRLSTAVDPDRPLEPYNPSEGWLQRWTELQAVYRRQEERGGIIDPEAERNRFLLSLSHRPDTRTGDEDRSTSPPASCPPPPTPPFSPPHRPVAASGEGSLPWRCRGRGGGGGMMHTFLGMAGIGSDPDDPCQVLGRTGIGPSPGLHRPGSSE
ncbi:E3 ubiquitin-protein ligase RNF25 [Leucoraja erinacea]|uniref:E3 ubiquitin-protein ligase RNF25 n=1 Tax=Leucoraja erinaceus TaxID=7782 RepID=UPI002454E953|nr:E3 ubiquitin-protein ligase RNF25 [Leucoraja erinacea]